MLACRAYNRYRTMKAVEVVLPKGLELSKPGWDLPKHPPEPDRKPPADEELLLDKISEAKHRSAGSSGGDSSGCSSAHESVTSSIDSGSHISSTSDSGTEHPRSPSGELRLRTVAPRKDYYTPTDNAGTQAWAAKNPPPGSYCVLGVDPNLPSDSTAVLPDDAKNIQYISCDVAPAAAPYVVTGEVTKPANPGYVPYNNSEHLDKSTGYVVAGNKTMLMPDLLQRDSPKNVPEKSLYVQVAEVPGSFGKFDAHAWSQPPEAPVNKSGYVSIGDASAVNPGPEHSSKGYVPHRHFEGKTLKED